MTDPEPQSPVVGRSELRVDVAQAVVTGMAATKLELRVARREIELVVHDENRFGRDAEESRECCN